MSIPTFIEVDDDVDKALKALIAAEYPGLAFKYSLVPDKPINDDGLQATWNGWRALLRRLQNNHLNPRDEYSNFAVGPELVDHTYTRSLSSARIQLRNRLWLCVIH